MSCVLGKEEGQALLIREQTRRSNLGIEILSREEGLRSKVDVEEDLGEIARTSSMERTGQILEKDSSLKGFTRRALNLAEGSSFLARKEGRGRIEKEPSGSRLI